ncbi:XK-related protein 5a [Erpetoichthys calabaricus]|uniref:XK-related protein n=1 Tax=Erpetoichthys calabaricus TaxID=27687 RepID=A0A8C4RS82_ERPCA|nr:XK-related protein 5a [Erpetoichthys calabaricus]
MADQRQKCCGLCCFEVFLLGGSALLLLAERVTLIYSIIYYFLIGQPLWAGLTFAFVLPASGVQLLSYYWFLEDGTKNRRCMIFIHILHLGIYKRYLDCIYWMIKTTGYAGNLGLIVMQQGDTAALHLMEALLLSLPQALLHGYLLVTTQISILIPAALSSGLCLLSLSWVLVLHSRASCLIRPGHVSLPPAALLCQLLWRICMLGSRITTLILFARAYHWWIFVVGGLHWLAASFWLGSQQSDIIRNPWRWRLFNCVVGAVHIFCFLNVKDGPSRYRAAAFYVVILLENAALLLLASDFLRLSSWNSLGTATLVLCSFIAGCISLILYYRFLHPKSTEISTNFQTVYSGNACWTKEETSLPSGNMPICVPTECQAHEALSFTGIFQTDLENGEISTQVTNALQSPGNKGHHHWLLVKVALKTGDEAKIFQGYGAGGATSVLVLPDHDELKDENVQKETEPEERSPSETEGEWAHGVFPYSESENMDVSQYLSVQASPEMASFQRLATNEKFGISSKSPSRGSPERRSVCFQEGLEYVGTKACVQSPVESECSSTLYFSADLQSPNDADKELSEGEVEDERAVFPSPLNECSPITKSKRQEKNSMNVVPKGILSKGEQVSQLAAQPRFTSTPKSDNEIQSRKFRISGVRKPIVPFGAGNSDGI